MKFKRFTFLNYCIFACLFGWLTLIGISFFIFDGAERISVLSIKIEFIIHVLIISILINIAQENRGELRKNILWLLAINFCLFIIDLCYYIGEKINNLPKSPLVEFSLYNLPGIFSCLFITFFIAKILLKNVLPHKKLTTITTIFAVSDIVIMLLFFSSLKYNFQMITWRKITEVIILTGQMIQYNFAIIGLIYAIDTSATLLLIGLIILLAGAYTYISNIVIFFPYEEMLWLLGLLFILFSVLSIKQRKNYEFNAWFKKENTIKNQLAFWSFSISTGGFLLLICITYSFSIVDKNIFLGLPLYVMMFSIFAIIFSIILVRNFEIPFKKIEKNIEHLKNYNSFSVAENDFTTEEFIYLQKFIVDAFHYKEEKDEAKKKIGEITAQVAHDIRSPLAAIDSIINSTDNRAMTAIEKVMIRTAFRRINNITNDLVAKYKGKTHERDTLVFVYVAIKDIISEKDLEYQRHNINFELSLDNPQSAFLLTEGNYKEIHRMFSNLINNSVNAMENGGSVKIICEHHTDNINVRIIDQGSGISNASILHFFGDENSNVDNEIGFGLKHAKNYFKKYGGSIKIMSALDEPGAEVLMSFPTSLKPAWLAEKIEIHMYGSIVIIDDDISIHDIWAKKLESLTISKKDFYSLEQAEEYLLENKTPDIILCDYEFKGSMTGLNFLEKIKHLKSKKYLITSHADNVSIIEQCEDNNFQFIPKHLLPYTTVSESFRLPTNSTENSNAVLIDDEVYNHEFWRYKAEMSKIILNCYLSLEDFMLDKHQIPIDTPIYVDLNLNKIRGLDVTDKLHDAGFKNLYITTGFVDFEPSSYSYLSGVVGKSPPF